ncbi:hypothetical protein [Glycomyces niveus]|uniref:Uncharacterized protein n=1 Tax=Glycomyces niveus TaxID=2820287 RepID=A0ABS3UBK2_9ACTN|nr:hypothetical protein [Glycomyces sp. NEAU-S30]MBO3735616.1 hypothetical protein [Glycomyces sp. NEAU-S30]
MGRLFRRVVRTTRRPRRSGGGTKFSTADGKQYRVVAVNEPENNEFADPPRKWGRVGVMAAAWALALALGGWVAPTFAASGNPENQDPRDEAASSEKNAAWRYLRYGSNQELDRSEATICDGASPEVSPSDLDDLRQTYADELGGITDVDLETGDPVAGVDGATVAATVSYIYQSSQRHEEFVVTVQKSGDTYCVSNAVRLQDEEPSSTNGTGEVVDPQDLATDFLRAIVVERNPQTAAALQCSSYTGPTPEELDLAITEWGATTAFLNGIEQAESTETSVTAFSVEVSLTGDLDQESYAFVIGVQGNCVASLTGGDGLI